MGVVAEIADRVVVMYAGKIVEAGTKEQIFLDPQHPYTWGLFNSIPPLTGARMKRLVSIPGAPPRCWTCRRAAPSVRAAVSASSPAPRCRRWKAAAGISRAAGSRRHSAPKRASAPRIPTAA